MELNGPTRFRHHRKLSSDRFLGALPTPPDPRSSASTTSSSSPTDELNEDDIFFSSDFSQDANESSAAHLNNHHQTSSNPAASSSSPRHLHHHQHRSFPHSDTFGILAAIRDPSRPHTHFYQKPSISTSASSVSSVSSSSSLASSSARMIPSIPKPPQERIPVASSLGRHHQSAPMNVPVLAKAMLKHSQFDDDYDVDADGEGEMLPPHEIVARSLAQSPMLSCSVLEGAGRTLKGRDLRQVRNAIWRQTGFLD